MIVAILLTTMLVVRAAPFGLADVKSRQASSRWLVISIVLVNLALTLITALKGKPWLALFAPFATVAGLIGALRLATPTSPWARRKQRLVTLIGGSPSPTTS